MNSVDAMVRRAQRDATIILTLLDVLATLQLLQSDKTGIDLRDDVEKLIGALALLGFSE